MTDVDVSFFALRRELLSPVYAPRLYTNPSCQDIKCRPYCSRNSRPWGLTYFNSEVSLHGGSSIGALSCCFMIVAARPDLRVPSSYCVDLTCGPKNHTATCTQKKSIFQCSGSALFGPVYADIDTPRSDGCAGHHSLGCISSQHCRCVQALGQYFSSAINLTASFA